MAEFFGWKNGREQVRKAMVIVILGTAMLRDKYRRTLSGTNFAPQCQFVSVNSERFNVNREQFKSGHLSLKGGKSAETKSQHLMNNKQTKT